MLMCLGIALVGFLLRNSFALIFDDSGAFWNPRERKNAPSMNRRVADGKTTVDLLHTSCIAHEIKGINSRGHKRPMRAAEGHDNRTDVIRLPSSRAARRTLRNGYRRARAARFPRW